MRARTLCAAITVWLAVAGPADAHPGVGDRIDALAVDGGLSRQLKLRPTVGKRGGAFAPSCNMSPTTIGAQRQLRQRLARGHLAIWARGRCAPCVAEALGDESGLDERLQRAEEFAVEAVSASYQALFQRLLA